MSEGVSVKEGGEWYSAFKSYSRNREWMTFYVRYVGLGRLVTELDSEGEFVMRVAEWYVYDHDLIEK
jgi:hypothetical protein